MPVFFFAGGAAGCYSYRRTASAAGWLRSRIWRLAWPVLPLLALWIPLPTVLTSLGVPRQPVALAAGIVGQLLWFLAVYLIMTALLPVMMAAHDRWGFGVPVALGAAAVGVDLLRFHSFQPIGYFNEVFVWLAVQQLGIAYADGRLGRKAGPALAVGGFTVTALLVAAGGYPDSMVGLPGQAVSNMSPATICLLTLGCGQIGVLLVARERLVAWSKRRGPARTVDVLGRRCMTIYLWHMSALVVVAGIAVFAFGYATPPPGSLAWLVAFPCWIGLLAVVLTGLVAVFGRVEGRRQPVGTVSVPRLGIAFGLLVVGLTGIAAQGFSAPAGLTHPGPWPWTVLIVLGLALTVPDWRPRLAERGTRVLASLVAGLPK